MVLLTIYIRVPSGAGVKCTSSAQETAYFSFFSDVSELGPRAAAVRVKLKVSA